MRRRLVELPLFWDMIGSFRMSATTRWDLVLFYSLDGLHHPFDSFAALSRSGQAWGTKEDEGKQKQNLYHRGNPRSIHSQGESRTSVGHHNRPGAWAPCAVPTGLHRFSQLTQDLRPGLNMFRPFGAGVQCCFHVALTGRRVDPQIVEYTRLRFAFRPPTGRVRGVLLRFHPCLSRGADVCGFGCFPVVGCAGSNAG